MNDRMQCMRLGLVALVGVVIVLGGWLTTGPVVRADESEHEDAPDLKVLAERIADTQISLVKAIKAAEKATGGVAVVAEYELEDDEDEVGLEIEVLVLLDQKLIEVDFDAMTGKMSVENDDDDDDDEEDDD